MAMDDKDGSGGATTTTSVAIVVVPRQLIDVLEGEGGRQQPIIVSVFAIPMERDGGCGGICDVIQRLQQPQQQ